MVVYVEWYVLDGGVCWLVVHVGWWYVFTDGVFCVVLFLSSGVCCVVVCGDWSCVLSGGVG